MNKENKKIEWLILLTTPFFLFAGVMFLVVGAGVMLYHNEVFVYSLICLFVGIFCFAFVIGFILYINKHNIIFKWD